MKKLLLILAVTVLCAPLRAAVLPNVYITQAGAGAQDGLSCATGKSTTYFNTSTNWGSAGPIGPGSIVHLCGVLTTPLVIGADGVAGNPITILFESGAQFTVPTLPTGSAFISKPSGNYIIVDGGANGIIQATANGSTPTYPNGNDFYGVHFPSCNHCEIKNLTVSNMFVFNSFDTQGGGGGIYIDAGTNNRVHNNILHDMTVAIWFGLDGSVGNEVDHNVAYRANWDYGGGSGGNGMTSFLIHDNEGYDWATWDDTSGPNSHHHNGIHVFVTGEGTAVLDGLQIYNNYFHGTTGCCTTAQIFIESPGNGNINATVYNNLLVATIAGSNWNNGFIGVHGSSVSHVTVAAYNNLLYSSTTAGSMIGMDFASGTTLTSQNNLFYNARMGGGPGMTINAANNWYYNAAPFDWGGASSFAQWQAACGCDANSTNQVDPKLNLTTFAPSVGSGVIGAGISLSNLGISALGLDKSGVARTGATWTIGAYNLPGAAVNPPAAVSITSIIAH